MDQGNAAQSGVAVIERVGNAVNILAKGDAPRTDFLVQKGGPGAQV